MNKSIISTLVLLAALVGSVHMQQQGQGMLGSLLGGLGGGANMGGQQMPGGNLLGGLLGGGRANGQGGPLDSILGGQQGGLLGQNGLLGQGGLLGGLGSQSGGMLGGLGGPQQQQQQQQQQGGLGQMLMQLPQRTIQMLGQLVNGVRNMIPGAGNGNSSQQLGRSQNQMMPRNPMDTLSQGAGGNNPLNSITNGLTNGLNGLTSNLPAPLNQLGSNLPNLNGLTNGLTQGNPLEGAARTVSDIGQGLSRTLSNVIPQGGATAGNI